MTSKLNMELAKFSNQMITKIIGTEFDELEMSLSNGVSINSSYWRFFGQDGTRFSSFDHKQRYGLQHPFNAFEVLDSCVKGHDLALVQVHDRTKDLEITFKNGSMLQIINVTAYEIWQIRWPDGNLDLSNYQDS